MPLIILCKRQQSARLAEPADLVGNGPPGPCEACGAATVFEEMPLPRGPDPEQMPPGYEVLQRLEGSTMAAMYQARHQASGALVALKVGLVGRDASAADHRRLRHEAARLALLRHSNIVRLVEAGEHAGLPFLSTEWHPAGSLADRLVRGALPHRKVVAWLEQISRAVHHSHRHAVLQNDLRLVNILFSAADEPKLIDFGISLKLDRPGGKARQGAACGDPRYTAPEQGGDSNVRIGPAADVHALGAVLYHALTGRPPFFGLCLHERLRRKRVVVPPLTALRPELPPALDRICRRCLHREPSRRYPTAEALAYELRDVLRR
jgi:serine/threonine-protein kinase